jgi:hypothetical protein
MAERHLFSYAKHPKKRVYFMQGIQEPGASADAPGKRF